MTVHYLGKFKGRYEAVNYCKRFAMTRILGMYTTDGNKVSCKACAKALGIAPAPVAVPVSKNLDGTCACCFSVQKTRTEGSGQMFKHGYTRPGYGYIVGGCPGDRFLPYEQSDAGTRYMADVLRGVRDGLQKERIYTQNTNVLNVEVQVRTNLRNLDGTRKYDTVVVALTRDGEPVAKPGEPYRMMTFSYEQEKQLYKLERELEHVERDIAMLDQRIEEFAIRAA